MATVPPSDRTETARRRARRRMVRARLAAAVAAAAVAWWAHAAAAEPALVSTPAVHRVSVEQQPLGQPAEGTPEATVGAAGVVRTVASLGAVLAVIGGAWWWLRRGGMVPVARGVAFEVLARHAVGRGQHVLIARFGSRVLCVQQTRDGLRTLSELTDAEEVAAMLATLRGGAGRTAAPKGRERNARTTTGAHAETEAADMRTVDLREGRAA